MRVERVDAPIVVGAGLAGLAVAVARFPSSCLLLTTGVVGEHSSTRLAQGGLAAAVGPDDNVHLHTSDTIAAGAGLCDPEAVRSIVGAGPEAVDWLERLGVGFDRDSRGRHVLGLEGAHGRRRILHVGGDASGVGLLSALWSVAAALPTVEVRQQTRVLRVLTDDEGVQGLLVESAGERLVLTSRRVVLATGGIGGLFAHTTNPLASRGQGICLAARAGATLRDLEMVQFHPTALDVGLDPMPLVSEAVRGEGAVLLNDHGDFFVDPLAARGVVSRASWAQIRRGRRILLDARGVTGFAEHFPQIQSLCADAGLDPRRDLLPVRPAAHYHMGGIQTSLDGATTVPGLFAVGECASTGLHGANRLASNSLLEAVVMGRRVAGALDVVQTPRPERARQAALREQPVTGPAPVDVRSLVERHVGITRTATGLGELLHRVHPWIEHDDAHLAQLLAHAALQREESRGAHQREDHPDVGAQARHTLPGPRPADLMEEIG